MAAAAGRAQRAVAFTRKNWRRLSLALAACVALSVWGYLYLGSPLRVARLAAAALQRKDAAGLIALASPVELRALRITPQAAEDCLQASAWRGTSEVSTRIHQSRPYYGDVLIFDVDFSGEAIEGRTQKSEIWVYQDPSGRWRLALSHLLYCAHQACCTPDMDCAHHWDAIARQAGLVGCTLPGGPTRFAADGSHSNAINLTGSPQ
jgi:hypothetical protein